jgi:sirohydrochlorin cobaltochelatase
MTAPCALILFAHGSRDPRWAEPFQRLARDAAAAASPARVRLAFMEFTGPTLADVAGELAAEGIRHARLLPLFMAGGAHVARDIPDQVAAVRDAHPELEIEVLAPIGEDPRVFALLTEIAAAAVR